MDFYQICKDISFGQYKDLVTLVLGDLDPIFKVTGVFFFFKK